MATIRDSIIGAAENLAGHTVNAGPTISDALDALTDVLAGEDVQGAQTIADAFAILGEHLDDNAPSGKITITENGTDIDIAQYATADVGVNPSGKITITANGTDIDIAQYATADVNVSGGGATLGNTVIVKAGATIEDFSFEIWLNDQYACTMASVDTSGVTIAAGLTIVIDHSAGASATIKIGDAEAQAMYDDTEIQAFTYTIPVDMETDTEIVIDGTGF